MHATNTTQQLLNRLRMRQVALLLAVDEYRTLRAAAQQLGMTQPAATKMLHELEDALGHTLFDRVGRGLKLNPAGQSVMNTFRGLRGSMSALGRELHELRLGSAGKLFVGSIMAAAPTYLSDALIGLKQRYPLLSVEISVGTSDRLIEQLRDGSLDVVIGRVPDPASPANQDCLFRPLGEEALSVVVACEHPLARGARRKPLKFQALLDYPWILQPRGSPMREVIEQEFSSHHAALPLGLIETASILTTTNLIARSEMVAVIPQSIASRYAQHGLLRILPYPITHTLTAWGVLTHRNRAINAMTQQFIDLLHGP
ncbi:MAG TPA: LysR family transcriptional regulator [Burkholderiaceae bacterium]|nr:LysR family transcriptional regulator [Burkholderiaceae bacterium]